MFSIGIELYQTGNTVVAYMTPCSEDERVGGNLEVADYVRLIALAVDIAIPEAVVILTLTGTDEGEVLVTGTVGILKGQTLIDLVGSTVVEALIRTVAEVPSEIGVDNPNIVTAATIPITIDCRSHVGGNKS